MAHFGTVAQLDETRVPSFLHATNIAIILVFNNSIGYDCLSQVRTTFRAQKVHPGRPATQETEELQANQVLMDLKVKYTVNKVSVVLRKIINTLLTKSL